MSTLGQRIMGLKRLRAEASAGRHPEWDRIRFWNITNMINETAKASF